MRKSDIGLRVAAVLLATLMLYPLSMGPMGVAFTRLHLRENGPARRAILTFYSPLNHLAEVSPAFGRVTDAYCTWWMRVAGASIVIRVDAIEE